MIGDINGCLSVLVLVSSHFFLWRWEVRGLVSRFRKVKKLGKGREDKTKYFV